MVLHSASTLLCCEKGWPRCLRKYDKQALLGRDSFNPPPQNIVVSSRCADLLKWMGWTWHDTTWSNHHLVTPWRIMKVSYYHHHLLYYFTTCYKIVPSLLSCLPSFLPERICQHVCCSIAKRIRKSSLLSGECVPGFIIELPGNERNHRCK